MINYARLRDKMGKHDVSLKSFSHIIDMAVAWHSQKYLTPPLRFITEEQRQLAREDAFEDVKDMPWEKIMLMAVDMEVTAEMGMDARQEEIKGLKETIWRTNNG